jgi:hypothetical protein
VTGERRGLPAVSIMTEQFVSAAALMAQVLGAPGLPFVTIDHPISSASTEELARRATIAADECAAILLN